MVGKKARRASKPRRSRGQITAKKQRKPYLVGKGKPPKEACFKPGQSGNPNGRPKGSSLNRLIKDKLDEANRKKLTSSNGEVVAETLVAKATKGNLEAIKIVLDRVEGKPRQRIDLGGTDGGAIPISIKDSIDRFYGA